ncbi:MAG: hypothetical protein ACLUKN_01000 [Bacilli bacterium]
MMAEDSRQQSSPWESFTEKLPIVEIKPDGGVYDFKRKYTSGSTACEFPAKFQKPRAPQSAKLLKLL